MTDCGIIQKKLNIVPLYAISIMYTPGTGNDDRPLMINEKSKNSYYIVQRNR